MNHMNTLCSYMCTYSQEGLSRENIVCNHNHFTNNKKNTKCRGLESLKAM